MPYSDEALAQGKMSIETCHSLVLILKNACIIFHHITHEWSEWLRSMRSLWKVSKVILRDGMQPLYSQVCQISRKRASARQMSLRVYWVFSCQAPCQASFRHLPRLKMP